MTDSHSGLPDPVARPEFYAGVPLKRGFAWIADTVLIGVLTLVALPLTAFLGVFFFPLMFLLIGFLYRWVTLTNGSATYGMRLFSIELRRPNGHRFDSQTALAHTLGYTVSVAVAPLQLISIALMLVSERGQGLTDHILGTAAIHRAS